MKPDGVNMETTEQSEAAAGAEPTSSQENLAQQPQPQPQGTADTEAAGDTAAAASAPTEVNGKPTAEVKPKTVDVKVQPKARPVGMSSPRPGTSSSRMANGSQSNASAAAGRKPVGAKASGAGAVPKRPAATSSTARHPTREPNKSSAGPSRAASAASASNGPRAAAPSSSLSKRAAPETANGARPKTTVSTSRTMASTVSKSTTLTTARTGAAAAKTARPATGPSATRPAFTTSRPTAATSRPPPAGAKSSSSTSSTSAARTAASRVTTAPSTGRSAAAQLPKSASPAAKKDFSRPPSTAVAKKPPTATASAATKKPDPTKVAAAVKPSSVPKQTTTTTTKAADTKVSHPKPQHLAKSTPTRKAVNETRFTAASSPSMGSAPPGSPATRPGVSDVGKAKYGKPTQNVAPFTASKKIDVSKAAAPGTRTQRAAGVERNAGPKRVNGAAAAATATAASLAAASAQAAAPEAVPEASPPVASAPEELPTSGPSMEAAHAPEEVAGSHAAVCSPQQSPVRTAPPEEQSGSSSLQTAPDEVPAPAEPTVLPVAPSTDPVKETAEQTVSSETLPSAAASASSPMAPSANLNEEEDEEEREGSQLVSVSEMSGTTQPTEESRPGSAGPAAGSAWRAGGALLSELDSEEVSGSQQGASELSAPGVLEGTESMDDLGDGSLKGAIDMEGASAGSPDFEKVPDIPVNDFDEDEDDDDSDRVCDMDVGSERTDELPRPRHDNDVDDEDDDDVEMASEGVTESGLESYGNADEDDFADDERLDNLNRMAQPPPPPALPSAPAAQWDQPNPFADPWAEPLQPIQAAEAAAASPSADPWQLDSETPTQTPAQTWPELASDQQASGYSSVKDEQKSLEAKVRTDPPRPGPVLIPEPETEVFGEPPPAAAGPTSNPSSSSVTDDEASDTEGEAQLEEPAEPAEPATVCNLTFDCVAPAQRCLSTVEEGEEAEISSNGAAAEDATPPSATSMASYGFDTMTTASSSNAQSTGESCIKSPGIFSLEELPEEAKEPCDVPQPHAQPCLPEQQYIECGKEDVGSAEQVGEEEGPNPPSAQSASPQHEGNPDDIQPPYYSTVCEMTDDSFTGLSALPLPHRRDHAAYPRTYYDIVKQHGAAAAAATATPKLTCADLPPRSPAQQALSPQLRRLEQHQRQLQEMQQRRAQQSQPLEEAEQERKRREEEEQRRKKEEAEEEIKRNKQEEEEERLQRKDLELQLQQQQEELKQRQQIMQWQQELQQVKGQTVLLSPSSGLCTIYEALENSDEEEADGIGELKLKKKKHESKHNRAESQTSNDKSPSASDSLQSPERPPPLDLDWGKKVDIVQQLINQTLLLNGDGCSSLLLLPGGAGGTLSPLESSLWPSLLPPLTPPSATVTSVSSFSPEATGSSPQGEWTVVELETHH
uniref:BTB/POZ domain-containing protein n=1 Tax=Salarias fasciatus TaxID=181472 RepID=A0A672FBF4_SALFA